MDVVRRYSLLATACLLGLAVLIGALGGRPSMSATAATRLARGSRSARQKSYRIRSRRYQ